MVPLRHVAYVIVQPCIDVKDASCVEVCPVDCIHTDDAANMYYIDPDECIDCEASVRVLEAAGVEFDWDVQQAGEAAIAEFGTPLPDHVLESIRKNAVALKGRS